MAKKRKQVYRSTAVYAGTFDPITNGHLDIIERASKLFDRVVVAVADSTEKTTLFPVDERVELIAQATKKLRRKVEVGSFDGLLVDYVQQVNAGIIIRGLRAVSDYEYESQMAMTNRQLCPNVETVFLMTSDHCSFISSSIVKQVAKHGGDVSELVPEVVAKRLKRIYS